MPIVDPFLLKLPIENLEHRLTSAAQRFSGQKPKAGRATGGHWWKVILGLGKSGNFNTIGRWLKIVSGAIYTHLAELKKVREKG
jgi:hypothetical protein